MATLTQALRPPAIDEHLVEEGSRYELLNGHRIMCPPADESHATEHMRLATLLDAHLSSGYRGALDMLTRVSTDTDLAPDISIYPGARDASTGGRQLEELVFEVVSEQALSVATQKARALMGRGVRRVFCMQLKRHRLLEYDSMLQDWRVLPERARLEDRCLVRPLEVRVLLDAALHDEAVTRALLARGNAVFEELRQQAQNEGLREGRVDGLREGRAQGKVEGKVESVLMILAARGLPVSESQREQLMALRDVAQVERMVSRALHIERVELLFLEASDIPE